MSHDKALYKSTYTTLLLYPLTGVYDGGEFIGAVSKQNVIFICYCQSFVHYCVCNIHTEILIVWMV